MKVGQTVKIRYSYTTETLPSIDEFIMIQGTIVAQRNQHDFIVLYMNPKNGEFEREVFNSMHLWQ